MGFSVVPMILGVQVDFQDALRRFDFKFYQDKEVTFNCADHGSDMLFWANEQEQEEIESLLRKDSIYFELEAQRTS